MRDSPLGSSKTSDVGRKPDTGGLGRHPDDRQLLPSPIRFDYAFIGVLLLLLVPALWLAHLPLRVDFVGMGSAYWGGTAVRAAFLAIVLAIAGLPVDRTLMP
jgi:hypothetical protein